MPQDHDGTTVVLTVADNEKIHLEKLTGTFGEHVFPIHPLAKSGNYTLDPGFMATASCQSSVTWIDGTAGKLYYRGYPIEQLGQHDFLEVAYALVEGDLPNAQQFEQWHQQIDQASNISKPILQLAKQCAPNSHPMGILMTLLSASAATYQDKEPQQAVAELIAQAPIFASLSHAQANGHQHHAPKPAFGYAANFLHMAGILQQHNDPKTQQILVNALNKIMILHADHEQNASTSTVRMAGSTGTNPIAAITAGVAALWGKAHGGANEACLDMLHTIGSVEHIEHFISKAKDHDDPFRLMGFGHRVYKNYDPRATIMRDTCHEVLTAVAAHDSPLFQLATQLEQVALKDSYFVERKLYPNVDFYSGITLSAMGIPSNLFTVLFALARTTGWAAHWYEMQQQNYPLCRPRQLYVGQGRRDTTPPL